jgi:hypothetical protein
MGHIISGYIDDSYLQGDTYNECAQNVTASSKLITELGFITHPEKSVLIPSQVLVFLGFILNSLTMTVSPTQQKGEKPLRFVLVCWKTIVQPLDKWLKSLAF